MIRPGPGKEHHHGGGDPTRWALPGRWPTGWSLWPTARSSRKGRRSTSSPTQKRTGQTIPGQDHPLNRSLSRSPARGLCFRDRYHRGRKFCYEKEMQSPAGRPGVPLRCSPPAAHSGSSTAASPAASSPASGPSGSSAAAAVRRRLALRTCRRSWTAACCGWASRTRCPASVTRTR